MIAMIEWPSQILEKNSQRRPQTSHLIEGDALVYSTILVQNSRLVPSVTP
jgi:hypothetical protein